MKIAASQIQGMLGDFKKNKQFILKDIKTAHLNKASFIVFPEAGIFGYPPTDFALQKNIIKNQMKEVDSIKKQIPKDLVVILGAFVPDKKGLRNAALVLQKGKPSLMFSKEHLAFKDFFFEPRYFIPGKTSQNSFLWKGKQVQILICEDLWKVKKLNSPDLLLCLNSSTYSEKKDMKRKKRLKELIQKYKCPAVYVNRAGAQDEMIFDGGSFFMNEKGLLKNQCDFFKPDLKIHDFSKKNVFKKKIPSDLDQTEEALVLGIKNFCSQTNISKIHIGLSGGMDSALVAYLSAGALGSKNIKAFFMPNIFTQKLSYKMAREVAKNLNISLEEMDIHSLYKTFVSFNRNIPLKSVTLENIQARIRMLYLMATCNETKGSLLIGTGNKSELACGYATLYGDLSGGLLPIGDLFKTEVYTLSRNIQKKHSVFPKEIFKKSPSAELKEEQKDTDSLPEYKILDPILKNLLNFKPATTKQEKEVLKLLIKSEFKRKQSPPILRVKDSGFGEGRKFPIAHNFSF